MKFASRIMHYALRAMFFFAWAAVAEPAVPPVPPGTNATPAKLDGPRIQFATNAYYFGKVESGDPVKYSFVFTNTGNSLLEIKDVRPGCGCTAAGEWDKKVEPGKSGKIPVQFNSGGYSGSVQKSISVACNDPSQPNLTLMLQGTIWKAIDVSPPWVMFNFGPDVLTNDERVVRIVSNLEEPLTVSEPVSGNPAFKPELKTIKEGKEYELRIAVVPPPELPNVSTQITLKTSYAKTPVITVSAWIMVQPSYSLNPAQILLPAGPLSNAMPFVISIQNNSTNSLELSDPGANVSTVDVQLKETQAGRLFNLTATFPAGFQSQLGQPVAVTVKTSNSKNPAIKIPVFQPAAPAPPPPAPAPSAAPTVAPSPAKPAATTSPVATPSESAANKATSPSALRTGPRIEFASPVFEFGRVESGQTVNHDFTFTNNGDQPLEIRDVLSSCGCTTARNAKQRVEPGKTGVIPVIFNSGGYSGPISKNLWVACNDLVTSNVLLQIKATVYKPIDSIPSIAAFGFGAEFQTNETRVIRLVSNLGVPVTISQPVCSNSAFRAELKTVREGKEFEVLVTVVPPLGPGSLSVPITMTTSSAKMPVVTVSAYVLVQPTVVVMPPRFIVPGGPLAKTFDATVMIENRSTNSMALSDPILDLPGVKLQLREIKPGRLFNLTASFPAGFNMRGDQDADAQVKTSHPQAPVVKVPVFQMASPDDGAAPAGSSSVPAASASDSHASARQLPVTLNK